VKNSKKDPRKQPGGHRPGPALHKAGLFLRNSEVKKWRREKKNVLVMQMNPVEFRRELIIDCNGTVSTLRNGFMELWLPRDRRIQLTISAKGRKAEGSIGTYDQSDTCITTFELK
jgi:hypothetical protein